MRTVPTLCASGAGISLSAIGLALARPDESPSTPNTARTLDMTTVATYTLPATTPSVHHLNFASSRSLSTPLTHRLLDDADPARRTYSSSQATTGQKRSLTPKASFGLVTDRSSPREDDGSGLAYTQSSRPRSWLRQIPGNISTSRDSSRTPTSRPSSAAVSQMNGSLAFSHSGSTTRMFPDNPPASLPPNKLVKRASSLRSTHSSAFRSSPGSRLPVPVLRRPATSHQRSATMQERLSDADQSDRMSFDASSRDAKSQDARDSPWRHYFTPKVAADGHAVSRKRGASGIPNPIKRMYPDRKHIPILISAREFVRPAQTEVDYGYGADGEDMALTGLNVPPSVASSPLLVSAAHFEGSPAPRRSFSIGDLLSTGPQPLWRRPGSSKGRLASNKLIRKGGRPRVTSAPHVSMGNGFSTPLATDAERPAKRRDISDPATLHGSIESYSSSDHASEPRPPIEVHRIPRSITPQSARFPSQGSLVVAPPSREQTPSPLDQRRLFSAATADHFATRPGRASATQSEVTSTLDSDSEYRSVGDYSTDQSDAVYDSFPTRTTRSSSGKRGPPIETIFDESPPSFSSGRSTKLSDFLGDGHVASLEHSARYRHSTIEEEGSILGTPDRSLHDKSITSTPSVRPGAAHVFSSSPPTMSIMPNPDEMDWDIPDETQVSDGLRIQQPTLNSPAGAGHEEHPLPTFGTFSRSGNAAGTIPTLNRHGNGTVDRASLFDWSEQQPSPSHPDQTPPRPRTVHGKKDPENRGSRSVGRRAPSGMHARSHSVPVVPDADGKRPTVVANKFGTWGVGSKAVTEDWNEDFDFDEPPATLPTSVRSDDKRIDSGHSMFVPRSIREQQENVVANISLLREWGLLIEELKELRIRAVALDMLHGPYAQDWQEVDAMIELADQESEEKTLEPRRSPPSSPGFDYGAFEEPMPNIAHSGRPRGASVRLVDTAAPTSVPTHTESQMPMQGPTQAHTMIALATRPRKDSEAVARSVIEALQSKRAVSDPTVLKMSPMKKVPFDTATLRHIVPYVNGLKRKVKDALRETEGLYSSPRRRSPPESDERRAERNDEPAFRSIFNDPQTHTSPTYHRSRRDRAATDPDGSEEPLQDDRTELARKMQTMSLPHS